MCGKAMMHENFGEAQNYRESPGGSLARLETGEGAAGLVGGAVLARHPGMFNQVCFRKHYYKQR